jgi:hypothetical protein
MLGIRLEGFRKTTKIFPVYLQKNILVVFIHPCHWIGFESRTFRSDEDALSLYQASQLYRLSWLKFHQEILSKQSWTPSTNQRERMDSVLDWK